MKQITLFLYRIFAVCISVLSLGGLFCSFYLAYQLPDRYYMAKDSDFSIGYERFITAKPSSRSFPLSVYASVGNTFPMNLRLCGAISIKDVSVQVVDRRVVSLCGTPFGIKMVTDGVMVVGTGSVNDDQNHANCPAKAAGIQEGDVILSLNGEKISSKKQLNSIVSNCAGKPIHVTLRRGEAIQQVSVSPAFSSVDQSYHLGLWVRDSSAGIGTMTFYDPANGCFAGLGHAICDVDTGQLMPLSRGQIVEATILGVEAGKVGTPGRLQGTFVADSPLGELYANSYNGVYGKLSTPPAFASSIPMAQNQEIKEGPVKILTTVEGKKPRLFDACIEQICISQDEPSKNMVIRIVDPELLALSGGIVQGMSGSPIIQDGMLVGAVTHVFVNDPTRGYGIFAENMNNSMVTLASSRAAA